MNQWGETNSEIDDAIADAARTYPLASVPSGLAFSIMSEVRMASARPRFQLQWVDLALGLFGASMVVSVWFIWQWLQGLPDWSGGLIANVLASLDPVDLWLGAAGVVGGLLILGMCLVLALVIFVPGPMVRLQPLVPPKS